jgi:two-component system, LytTR family, sensor kinase
MRIGPIQLDPKRLGTGLLTVAIITLTPVFLATIAFAFATIEGEKVNWLRAVRGSVAHWFIWVIIGVVIVAVDRKLPIRREALRARLLIHIPLSIVFTSAAVYLSQVAGTLSFFPDSHLTFYLRVYVALAMYWGIVGVYVSYEYHRFFQERSLRAVELEKLLSETRLEALRNQLHPHFLFNVLNTISAYVERDPRRARRMVEHLAELLRMCVKHSRDQEVTLGREVAFLEKYLEIQRVRFEDQFDVDLQVSSNVMDALVPTFILQPLVENAIQHGVSNRSQKGTIFVKAWHEDSCLRLSVEDDGPGLPPSWEMSRNVGVGIANTCERLENLYGADNQRFELGSAPGSGVKVDVTIPFHTH